MNNTIITTNATTSTKVNNKMEKTSTKFYHKMEKRQVRSSLIANCIGNNSKTLASLYANLPEFSLTMYTSALDTMSQSIFDNTKTVDITAVKSELDKFASMMHHFKLPLSFTYTFSKGASNGLDYVVVTPVIQVDSPVATLTKEDFINRLTVIADSQMPELVEVLPTLSLEVLQHIYSLSQKYKQNSNESVDLLFGIQDNVNVVKWFVTDNFTKACHKAFVEKDND